MVHHEQPYVSAYRKQWANGRRRIENARNQELTWTIVPRARVLYVYLARYMMESQEPPREDRDRVLLVVHMRHETAELSIDEIGKILIPDAGHPVAHYAHSHAWIELQPEVDAVEEGERRAERVAHGRDG
jgi:hypothetical protein